MFTGDRSGNFLFEALHATGFANQARCVEVGDGLTLRDAAITAICHCAPPGNKPQPDEIRNCAGYLRQTFELMPNLRGVVALGQIALDGVLRFYKECGWLPAGPRPRFGHGVVYRWPRHPFVICTYHPSQQNTFTGKLTQPMLRAVLARAKKMAESGERLIEPSGD